MRIGKIGNAHKFGEDKSKRKIFAIGTYYNKLSFLSRFKINEENRDFLNSYKVSSLYLNYGRSLCNLVVIIQKLITVDTGNVHQMFIL